MVKAKIEIMPKKAVLDPQGKAIEHSLSSLGYIGVLEVRVGKLIELKLEMDIETAKREVNKMCERLLANPIVEDYKIELIEN